MGPNTEVFIRCGTSDSEQTRSPFKIPFISIIMWRIPWAGIGGLVLSNEPFTSLTDLNLSGTLCGNGDRSNLTNRATNVRSSNSRIYNSLRGD